jgi:hypothetical protein
MRPALGFPETVGGAPALLRLRMALYGLRQSAREWAITLIEWLLTWGFRRFVSDSYVFIYEADEGILVLLLWVDDIFMGHSDDGLRGRFMHAFSDRFRVKDLGLLKQGLGAQVFQDPETLAVSFSLERYIVDAGRRFDIVDEAAWADIPVPVALAKEAIAAQPTDAEVAVSIPTYRPMSGVIVFIATFARPDLCYAAHLCGTFNRRPGPVHLRLARRVLAYAVRTAAMRISYSHEPGQLCAQFSTPREASDEPGAPVMDVDTDHGVRRSITGWVIMYAGAAVTWATRPQSLPSLSSTESELYGLSTGVCDLLITVHVLEEFLVVFSIPIHLYTDSRGARLLTQDSGAAARTRHIHRRWFFVQHHVEERRLSIKQLKGCDNMANFLTKPVGGQPYADSRSYSLGGEKMVVRARARM